MKYFILFSFFIVLSCSNTNVSNQRHQSPEKQKEISTNANDKILNSEEYAAMIAKWKNKASTNAQKYNFIMDSILPNWYGTTWNFYGTTTVPNEGTIACGYFVTTITQHANIPVARVKLAQQVSSKIITTLCPAKSIGRFADFDQFKQYFNTYPNKSLFIVGLDCHTGFIAKEKNELYFIHSSYISPAVVKKEDLFTAIPITSSKNWWVGSLL